jgi:hypothetical protein
LGLGWGGAGGWVLFIYEGEVMSLLFGLICRRLVRAGKCAGNVSFQSSEGILQELAERFLAFVWKAISQACGVKEIAFEDFHIERLACDGPRYHLMREAQSVESFGKGVVCFIIRNPHRIALSASMIARSARIQTQGATA